MDPNQTWSDLSQAVERNDWQEATEFNFYYQGQVTEANLNAATNGGLDTVTDDFKYAPDQATEIPTLDNGGVKVPGDSGDAMTVTWKLRPGLKWSDGEALTCDDYKFTQDWIMDKDNTGLFAGRSGYEDVKKFECTDPQTIVLHFGKIYEGYLGMYGSPLPKHYLSKFTVKEDVQHKGMGAKDMPKVPVSGPFKYVSVTSGSEIRLARNEVHEPPHRQAGAPRRSRLQVVRRSGRNDRGLPEQRDRRRVRPPGLGPPEGPGPRRPGRGDPGPAVRVPAPQLVAGPVHH
jgi:peptide/nickel transport system substrate-binding protein